MNERTGLSAEVPTLDLCREMAATPALAEGFKKSTLVWQGYQLLGPVEWQIEQRRPDKKQRAAPTVREMLAVAYTLGAVMDDEFNYAVRIKDNRGVDITDPDALARACIEAAK